MKKTVIIVLLILLVGLLAAGCANRNNRNLADDGTDDSKDDVPAEAQQTETKQDKPVDSNVSSVTQEDLDKLKADIEGLEAEDVGGLTSD